MSASTRRPTRSCSSEGLAIAVMNKPGASPHEQVTTLRVGISACLLGQEVRFDGGHKRDRYITDGMKAWAGPRLEALARANLSGYILKSDSPSCGMERVRVYRATGIPCKDGVGVFARALMERFPGLPIEEEGRLHDLPLRENFVERVSCYRRWRDLVADGLTRRKLVAFHAAHKLLLLAHSPKARPGCR